MIKYYVVAWVFAGVWVAVLVGVVLIWNFGRGERTIVEVPAEAITCPATPPPAKCPEPDQDYELGTILEKFMLPGEAQPVKIWSLDKSGNWQNEIVEIPVGRYCLLIRSEFGDWFLQVDRAKWGQFKVGDVLTW